MDVPKENMMDIGIPEDQRLAVAKHLSRLLADTYLLYLKTHNFHWNVKGPRFRELHLMWEEQYTAMWTDIDIIAERIRALGEPAPATYQQFMSLASIEETEGVPSANDMLQLLLDGHEAVVRTARTALPVADEANDEVTVDLLTQRLEFHEKTAWMLRTSREE